MSVAHFSNNYDNYNEGFAMSHKELEKISITEIFYVENISIDVPEQEKNVNIVKRDDNCPEDGNYRDVYTITNKESLEVFSAGDMKDRSLSH